MTATTMPAVFVGHGSPMNTLERNRYTETWRRLGASVPRPRAILAVSAHWYINAMGHCHEDVAARLPAGRLRGGLCRPRYGDSAAALSRLSLDTDGVLRDGWADQLAVVSGSNEQGYVASLLVRV